MNKSMNQITNFTSFPRVHDILRYCKRFLCHLGSYSHGLLSIV